MDPAILIAALSGVGTLVAGLIAAWALREAKEANRIAREAMKVHMPKVSVNWYVFDDQAVVWQFTNAHPVPVSIVGIEMKAGDGPYIDFTGSIGPFSDDLYHVGSGRGLPLHMRDEKQGRVAIHTHTLFARHMEDGYDFVPPFVSRVTINTGDKIEAEPKASLGGYEVGS